MKNALLMLALAGILASADARPARKLGVAQCKPACNTPAPSYNTQPNYNPSYTIQNKWVQPGQQAEKKEIDSLRANLKFKEGQVSDLFKKLEEAQANRNRLQAEVDRLKKEISKMGAQDPKIIEENKALKSTVARLEEQISKLETDKMKLAEETNLCKQKVENYANELADCQAQNEKLSTKITGLEEQVTHALDDAKSWKEEAKSKNKQIKSLTDTINLLKKKLKGGCKDTGAIATDGGASAVPKRAGKNSGKRLLHKSHFYPAGSSGIENQDLYNKYFDKKRNIEQRWTNVEESLCLVGKPVRELRQLGNLFTKFLNENFSTPIVWKSLQKIKNFKKPTRSDIERKGDELIGKMEKIIAEAERCKINKAKVK